MGIYRGPGGTGDAVADTSNQSASAVASAAAAAASATAASSSASSASTSATNAANSATSAATSAANASTSATSASTSASNAATSASNAAASYDSFDDRYLGAKSSAPSVDNDGDALITGALYWNTTDNKMYSWSGSAWEVITGTGGSGSVTSVAMSVPTGLSVSGSPITSSGTLAVSYASGYSIPTTASQTNWDTAYTDRLNWDGGSTGLNATTGRTSLGLGSIATQSASNVSISGGSITGITDLAVADGGTGSSTATGARVNLLPSYTGNGGKVLAVNTGATDVEWVAAGSGSGTVTSVALSMPSGFSVSGSPVTSSGTLAVSTTLNGVLKGNGSGFTTATAGTDYLAPAAIGSTVLAYDSNLQSFVNTFTLPTTDSTSGYVLSTNGSGTLSWIANGSDGSMVYPGAGIAVSTGSAWGTSLTAPTGTIVGTSDSQTLTNKTISGSSNTLSNIGNSSLTNSSITINGSAVSLGGSATITAANPNALTIGTGLSGTSYNGSSAVTIAIDSTVATLSGTQTLTNKTLTDSTTFFQDETDNTKKLQFQLSGITTATTRTLTVPNVNGTIITSGDTSTVTNTMLAGSIANNKLANSSVTIGSTAISLGGTSTTLAGLSSVTSTSFVGALTGNASTATTLQTARNINGVSFDGSANITITANTTNALTIGTGLSGTSFNGSGAVTIAIDSTVATLTGTQTLTNKRITPRVSTTASSATPTINTDNVDMFGLTAQAADITSFTTNLSGTPTDGQKLWIYIVGTAARAITWGASFEASTVALPTTTVSTNRLDVGFVWNAATSKWRCVAAA